MYKSCVQLPSTFAHSRVHAWVQACMAACLHACMHHGGCFARGSLVDRMHTSQPDSSRSCNQVNCPEPNCAIRPQCVNAQRQASPHVGHQCSHGPRWAMPPARNCTRASHAPFRNAFETPFETPHGARDLRGGAPGGAHAFGGLTLASQGVGGVVPRRGGSMQGQGRMAHGRGGEAD